MVTLFEPQVGTVQAPGPATTSTEASTASGPSSSLAGVLRRPLQVTWEMTQACNWKATPVRARVRRDRDQFSTAEAFHLVEEVAAMRVPLLTLTGGDPLLRPDLLPIIEFAANRSVRTSLTLLPTPKLDASTIAEFKASGLMRIGFWLHGSTAALDDAY
jgi:MoaA/NifB/PqqE/SkfB family radical SAM enzyme